VTSPIGFEPALRRFLKGMPLSKLDCLAASKLRPLDRCHELSTDVTDAHEIRVDQVLLESLLVRTREDCVGSAVLYR
jgi:hypothetical protein